MGLRERRRLIQRGIELGQSRSDFHAKIRNMLYRSMLAGAITRPMETVALSAWRKDIDDIYDKHERGLTGGSDHGEEGSEADRERDADQPEAQEGADETARRAAMEEPAGAGDAAAERRSGGEVARSLEDC